MRQVFLDTVALLALWEKRDQWHDEATRVMETLRVESARLITTPEILLECGNAASRKPYRDDVAQLWAKVVADGRLFAPTAEEEARAWEAYRAAGVGGAGIVDQISFVVMRRLGITDAFTNDRHFKAAGFNTLF